MKAFLRHLFLPHHSNNHRPKLLHPESILAIVIMLLSLTLLGRGLHTYFPNVLGTATNIVQDQLLTLTNQEREANGLSTLVVSDELSRAAYQKAQDMFAKDYWAHVAPDGTTPWVFIKNSGYTYVHAGENLARGFNESSEVTTAWMNSPTHRENVLSPHYKEIGFAIVNGKLQGEETTLVVEMFGSRETSPTLVRNASSEEIMVTSPTSAPLAVVSPSVPTSLPLQNANPDFGSVASVQTVSLIDMKGVSRNLSMIILFGFLGMLAVDMIVIERKKIVRFVGHNLDHMFFLGAISFLLLVLGRGGIV